MSPRVRESERHRLVTLRRWDYGPSLSSLCLTLNHIAEPIKESFIVQSLRGREGRDVRGTQKGCRLGWELVECRWLPTPDL